MKIDVICALRTFIQLLAYSKFIVCVFPNFNNFSESNELINRVVVSFNQLNITELSIFDKFYFTIISSNSEIFSSISVLSSSRALIFQTSLMSPFLRLGNATVLQPPILNGNFQMHEYTEYLSDDITIDNIVQDINSQDVTVCGSLTNQYNKNLLYNLYCIKFIYEDKDTNGNPCEPRLKFEIEFNNNDNTNEVTDNPNLRLFFNYWCARDESFHGFGESFTYFDLKGKVLPILVSEQGLGRGEEPITDVLNANTSEGSGGYWYTTYAPKALYVTNKNRSMFFDESVIMIFNLTQDNNVELEVWSVSLKGYIFSGNSWLDLVESITSVVGRQQGRLPSWSQRGAIVGLEGGTSNVSAEVAKMMDFGVPIAGVWLQDWVGLRHSWDGDRLIWNWELNSEWYPNWNEMVEGWADKGARVLTYISPFFSDPTNFTTNSTNFYQEGIDNGYFVKHADGSPYTMYSLSIEFCMIDPTNPAAVRWMIDLIKVYTLEKAQSSGWMCDFGEYLPFDASLYSGESSASYHNKYPEAWGQIAHQAIAEANRSDDVLFFMRSSWTRSPASVPVFWLGDQLMSWDGNDGIKTVITGALTGGLTGQSVTHSDIGGYNVVSNRGPTMYYIRSVELLKRWSELAAFGSALFRTHIGSSTTLLNAQIYDSNDTMSHFKEFASIFSNLSNYRATLLDLAASKGYPLMRPLAMHYFYDTVLWTTAFNTNGAQLQYLFGEDFLIAPTVDQGADAVSMYLPAYSGPWIHLWSGLTVTLPLSPSPTGLWLTVPAGIGFPCVFYKASSVYGDSLRAFVMENNYDEGYFWDYGTTTSTSSVTNSNEIMFFLVLLALACASSVSTVCLLYLLHRKLTKDNSNYQLLVASNVNNPCHRYPEPIYIDDSFIEN